MREFASSQEFEDLQRDASIKEAHIPELNIPKNYRPWSPWVTANYTSPFTGKSEVDSLIDNPYYRPEARIEFEEDRKRAIRAATKASLVPGNIEYRVKVRGYIPQETGVSQMEELEVFNPQFFKYRWSVRQALGRSIASRRREASRLNKTYFEFPKISISSTEPVSYYKGGSTYLNTSGGRLKPEEGFYTLNSRGRWPKRDGHLVEVTGVSRTNKWNIYPKVPVFDLDTRESLIVPLGYLKPIEEDTLRWCSSVL